MNHNQITTNAKLTAKFLCISPWPLIFFATLSIVLTFAAYTKSPAVPVSESAYALGGRGGAGAGGEKVGGEKGGEKVEGSIGSKRDMEEIESADV